MVELGYREKYSLNTPGILANAVALALRQNEPEIRKPDLNIFQAFHLNKIRGQHSVEINFQLRIPGQGTSQPSCLFMLSQKKKRDI